MLGRIAKNTSIYSIGELAARMVAFALVPVYTVLLAPEELALWGLGAMVLQLLTTVYGLGIPGGLLQFQYDFLDDEDGRRRCNGAAAAFLLVWPIGMHAVLEVVGPSLLATALPDLPWDPYGRLVSLAAVLGTAAVVPIAVWTSQERPKPFILLNISRSFLEATLVVALLATTAVGVLAIFVGKLVGAAVVGVPLTLYTLRRVDLGWRREHLLPLLAFSVPLVPHLLSTWALTMVDRWLLVDIAGRAELGLYTVAYFFPVAINVLSMSGYRAWSPTFHKGIDDPTRHPTLRRSTTWFALAVGVAAVGAASVGPDTARALFDPRYADSADLVRLLAFGAGFQGLYYVYVAALYNRKRRVAIPAATVFAASVNVALNLWWIPEHGAKGAAAATLVSYAVLTLAVFLASRRILPVPLDRRLLGLGAVSLAVAFAVAEAAGWAVSAYVTLPPRAAAIASIVARGAAFAVVLIPALGPRLRPKNP